MKRYQRLYSTHFFLTKSILAYSLWTVIALVLALVLSLEWADEPVNDEPAGKVFWVEVPRVINRVDATVIWSK